MNPPATTLIYEDAAGELQIVRFDAVIKEQHESTAQVTTHPLARNSDGMVKDPLRLTLEVHVTNTPIRSPNADGAFGDVRGMSLRIKAKAQTNGAKASKPRDVKSAQYDEPEQDVSVNVLQFSSPFDRVKAVRDQLDALQTNKTRVTVISPDVTFENMVITSISRERTAASGNAATFTIELFEFKISNTSVVDAPEPLERRAEAPTNRGAQSTVEIPRESIAHRAANFLLRSWGRGDLL